MLLVLHHDFVVILRICLGVGLSCSYLPLTERGSDLVIWHKGKGCLVCRLASEHELTSTSPIPKYLQLPELPTTLRITLYRDII